MNLTNSESDFKIVMPSIQIHQLTLSCHLLICFQHWDVNMFHDQSSNTAPFVILLHIWQQRCPNSIKVIGNWMLIYFECKTSDTNCKDTIKWVESDSLVTTPMGLDFHCCCIRTMNAAIKYSNKKFNINKEGKREIGDKNQSLL